MLCQAQALARTVEPGKYSPCLPYWSSLGAQRVAKSAIPAFCAGCPELTPVSALPNLPLTGTDTRSGELSKYWSVSSRLLVLILFPASGSPLIFKKMFSHPIPPSNMRFHEESKWAAASRYPHPLPLAALLCCLPKSPTLDGHWLGQSLRLRFWEWYLEEENTSFEGMLESS